MSNLVAERYGVELIDAVDADEDGPSYRGWLLSLLVRALPHREPNAISDRTIELLHENDDALVPRHIRASLPTWRPTQITH